MKENAGSDITRLTAEQTAKWFGIKLTNREAVDILNAASKLEGHSGFFTDDGCDPQQLLAYDPDAPVTIEFDTSGEQRFNLGAMLWVATIGATEPDVDSPVMRNARNILATRRQFAA
jgi:hypothetical protein